MTPSVTWMLLDKLGGIYNFVANLLAYRDPDGLYYQALLARNLNDVDDSSDADLRADAKSVSFRLPPDNFHTVLRRLARELRAGPGVIVANDWLSLAMASGQRTGKSVVYINHGDFQHYYDLAVMHDPTIDLFITYTERMRERLVELLPHRRHDIRCIRYGVEIPQRRERSPSERLRLLYVGRLDRPKGVFDLPEIDRALKGLGVSVQWTIQGPGPAEHELRALWSSPDVQWLGRTSMARLKDQYFEHDVLVLPFRAEGLPVALLEGMASGCVPVVSDLASGIPEIVENGVSGYRVAPGNISGFADAIRQLSFQRDLVSRMSDEGARRIASGFNIEHQAREYQTAISGIALGTPRWSRSRIFHGSRLDRPWLPNSVVRTMRALRTGLNKGVRRAGSEAMVAELPHDPNA